MTRFAAFYFYSHSPKN